MLVFLFVVLAYVLYKYVDWTRYWQMGWRSVGLSGEAIPLSSTAALSTADLDESLLSPSSSRARRAAAAMHGGDSSSRAVR